MTHIDEHLRTTSALGRAVGMLEEGATQRPVPNSRHYWPQPLSNSKADFTSLRGKSKRFAHRMHHRRYAGVHAVPGCLGSIIGGSAEPPTRLIEPSTLPPSGLRWRVAGTDDENSFIRPVDSRWPISSVRLPSWESVSATSHALLGSAVVAGAFSAGWNTSVGVRNFTVWTLIRRPLTVSEHLLFADLRTTTHLPPLPFPDEHFDLVFNHSVFTHLDADYQDLWLEELRRITQPNGIVILTVQGSHAFAQFEVSVRSTGADSTEFAFELAGAGLLFIEDDVWKDGRSQTSITPRSMTRDTSSSIGVATGTSGRTYPRTTRLPGHDRLSPELARSLDAENGPDTTPSLSQAFAY